MWIYTKNQPKQCLRGDNKDTIAYEIKWYELPFAILIENNNLKKITLS